MENLYYSMENKSFLSEHTVMTPKQEFLALILFCYVFQMAVAITFLCKNAVEVIQFFFAPSHEFGILEYRTNT